MKSSWLKILFPLGIFGLFMIAFPSRVVQADAGPHPSMQFVFISRIRPAPSILSGQLLECTDEVCALPQDFQQIGPQRFECQANSCYSSAYSYSPYHRLEIGFSDGVTRRSNIFTRRAFAADYVVAVYAGSLEVEEKVLGPNWPFFQAAPTIFDLIATLAFPLLEVILPIVLLQLALRAGRAGATLDTYYGWMEAAWLLAIPAVLVGIKWTQGLIVTLLVELLLGAGYALWKRHPLDVVLTVVLLLNLITQPVLWITISAFSGLSPVVLILFAEITVCLLEAGGLYCSRRNSMRFKDALWVSFALNAASFMVGSFLPV